MPIPSTITDLSTSAGSNSPSGSDSPNTVDDHIRAQGAILRKLYDDVSNGTLPAYNATRVGGTAPSVAGLALIDDVDAAAQRTTLGLGTAATKDVGTGANQVVQADSSGNYGFGTAPTTVKMTIDGSFIIPVTHSYTCYTQDYGVGTPDASGLQVFAGSGDPVRIGKRVAGVFTEYFRSGPAGQWGIGGANYGTAGHVLTSGGSGAPPTWTSVNPSTYTSTVSTLPAAAAVVSTSHGLGSMPAEAVLEITCTTADGGYSVGDVLQHPHMGNGVGTGWPLSVWKSSTAVGFTLASGFGIGALRKDTGQAFIPNASSWSYRFRLVAA